VQKQTSAAWLLLAYKLPAEPTKLRVGIWRQVRSLGAVYLQGSLCVLPATAEHSRRLRVVRSEIERAGGEAVIFEALALDPKQQASVVARFKHDRDQDYAEFLERCDEYRKEIQKEVKARHYAFAEVKENEQDLKKLKAWLERIKALDFYGAPACRAAEEQLAVCEALLESYTHEVFEREQNARLPAPPPVAKKRAAAKAAGSRRKPAPRPRG
jgi:hypothetical protein